MAEPANSSTIVRAGVDPMNGSPLSAESRQAIFNRATISSAAFRGNNNLIAPQKDNEETLEAIQTNQQTLSGIQQQIINLRSEIGGLNSGLSRISQLLQEDSILEQRQIQEQQENERRLTEAKVRLGKEDQFENKIQQAIVAPVQALAPRVTDLFGSVTTALSILFAGWLTNQTIEYLKAEGEKNTEKLREIKNNILKNVGIGAGILIAIRAGFSGFILVLKGVIGKIAGLLGKIVAAPFKAAAGLASSASNILTGKGPKPGGGTPPPKPTGGGPLRTAGNILKGAAGPLLTGAVTTGLDIAGGEDPAKAAAGGAGAAVVGTGGAILGSPLGPVGSFVLGTGGALLGQQLGKGVYDNITGKPQENSQEPAQTTSTPITPKIEPAKPSEQKIDGQQESSQQNSQPQTSMVPSTEVSSARPEYNISDIKIEKPEEKQQATNTQQTTTPSAEIYSPNKNTQPIKSLPEPQPTVIMAPSSRSEQPTQPPMNSGPLSDVPLIPSANPDNFYVLYSQMHYNVVM